MYSNLPLSFDIELENPVNYGLPHTCYMNSQSQKWFIQFYSYGWSNVDEINYKEKNSNWYTDSC